jgi:hypothetical protein
MFDERPPCTESVNRFDRVIILLMHTDVISYMAALLLAVAVRKQGVIYFSRLNFFLSIQLNDCRFCVVSTKGHIYKMTAEGNELFTSHLLVENKDIYVDVKKNKNGIYLKISERNGNSRNTVLIPASGIPRLREKLDEAESAANAHKKAGGAVR